MMTRARQPSAPSTEDPPAGEPPVPSPAEPRPEPAADQATPAPSDPRPSEPPAGGRKARLARLKRDHPVLYAARHVGAAVLEVLAGLLGLGVLLRSLLPRIDWSWIPLPHIDLSWLPDITKPEWLRYLDVVYWIRRFVDLPDLTIPAWLPALAGNLKYVVPILVAVIVATAEVQRRKRKQPAGSTDATGNDETGEDGDAEKPTGETPTSEDATGTVSTSGPAPDDGSAPDGQVPTDREKAEDHADR